MKIRIKRFDKSLPLPTTDTGAACFDMTCRERVIIPPHGIRPVPQNVALQVPEGYACLLFSRSSTSWRKGLMLANGVGVIDPFYCGDKDEFLALLLNITAEPVTVEVGEKLVQGMFIQPASIAWDEVGSFATKGHGGYSISEEVRQ